MLQICAPFALATGEYVVGEGSLNCDELEAAATLMRAGESPRYADVGVIQITSTDGGCISSSTRLDFGNETILAEFAAIDCSAD